MQILVGDDSKLIREVYKNAFTKKGHHIITSESGKECLEKYEKSPITNKESEFNVVILDYNLPDMKGNQIAEKILDINPIQKIIISDSKTEILREAFKNISANVEILQKGFPIQALVSKIESEEDK